MMTGTEIAQHFSHTTIEMQPADVNRIKLTFLLNLIAGRTFADVDLINARDALVFDETRAIINRLLGLPYVPDPFSTGSLVGPNAKTVVPLQTMEDDPNIERRVIAFLRPDAKMMVEVEKQIVNTEPSVTVFQVTIEDGRGGSWREAFGSEDMLYAFLRGIRATYAMSDLQKMLPDLGDHAPLVFTEQSAVRRLP